MFVDKFIVIVLHYFLQTAVSSMNLYGMFVHFNKTGNSLGVIFTKRKKECNWIHLHVAGGAVKRPLTKPQQPGRLETGACGYRTLSA